GVDPHRPGPHEDANDEARRHRRRARARDGLEGQRVGERQREVAEEGDGRCERQEREGGDEPDGGEGRARGEGGPRGERRGGGRGAARRGPAHVCSSRRTSSFAGAYSGTSRTSAASAARTSPATTAASSASSAARAASPSGGGAVATRTCGWAVFATVSPSAR